jgi:hypothetical protein
MSATELHWVKSSYSSGPEPGDCVEVATALDRIHVRDSKTACPDQLTVSPGTWSAFVTGVCK